MKKRIPNPWEELPCTAPIVAPVDAPLFARHPEWTNAPALLLDRLPSPFSGALEAPVIMLGLIPSGKDDDSELGPEYTAQRRAELRFAADRPFISLNPKFAHAPGYDWHYTLLRRLILAVGRGDADEGRELVARGLLWLQLFGYQCETWDSVPPGLRLVAESGDVPSQAFAIQVARDAIASGKIIIVGYQLKEVVSLRPRARGLPLHPDQKQTTAVCHPQQPARDGIRSRRGCNTQPRHATLSLKRVRLAATTAQHEHSLESAGSG